MSKKKSRKYGIGFILGYSGFILFMILVLAGIIIFVPDNPGKVGAIIYTSAAILVLVALPVYEEISERIKAKKKTKKEAKKRQVRYGISKEQYDNYLQQSKNCDIFDKWPNQG